MNILEHIAESRPREDHDGLIKDCTEWYNKYLIAYRNQYTIGTPPAMIAFLALPWECAKALCQEPGSLVKIHTAEPAYSGNGLYAIVEEWKMSDRHVILKVRNSRGEETILGASEFEPSDIPQGVVDAVRASITKNFKCPMMQ